MCCCSDISEEVLRQMQGIQAELAMTETLSLQAEQSLLDLNNDAISVSTISSQVMSPYTTKAEQLPF